ncbi:hypothetical protein E2P81_ATG02097 [Venturia nashicola]|nr:hypothetical protein E2P81_ATG02097 [Venturia nashicola]
MEAGLDLIVAIDYGMTCTGVAYANLTRGESVRWIQKWPGRAQANENKVPTVLVYDKHGAGISSWGFMSETRAEQNNPTLRDYCDWFKTFLDPTVLAKAQAKDPKNSPKSQAAVDQWTEDYLRLLFQHIESKLSQELESVNKPWSLATIDFVFSVPTTWPPSTVNKFRVIASRAGFASHATHTLNIGLTEAEAAAVYVSVEAQVIFAENQVLLVCDAGGGTTDLSVMQVSGLQRGLPALKQLDVVSGRNIGSAQIDQAFEDMVLSRLEQANERRSLGLDLEDAAWMMMKSAQYQDAKCCYGSPDDTDFSVLIPKLDLSYTNERFRIVDGAMKFTLADLQQLFDTQITRLFELIDSQMESFDRKFPNDSIAHLVLSGGLGNSAYVQRKMKQRYAMNVHTSLQVHVAPEPQLAVCKGIVLDWLRTKKNQPVLEWRCCRSSYGTECKVLYDPKNPEHIGQSTHIDPLNQKQYITKAIAWFVTKGDPINVNDSISHKFSRRISPGDPRRAFPENVVQSDLDKQNLPFRIGPGVKILCEVKSDLSTVDETKFKVKNRHWWNFKEKYMRVDYLIKVVVGPADLQFQLWFDGQMLKLGDPIQVKWEETSAPESPVQAFDSQIFQDASSKGFARASVLGVNRTPHV